MSGRDNPMDLARRLAATPEGKQLADRLQQLGGGELKGLLDQVAAGNVSQAKQAISLLLQDPVARQLLEALGGLNGK